MEDLKGEQPVTVRPGSLLPDADLMLQQEKAKGCASVRGDYELSPYLVFPKVFVEFAAAQRRYGPVSVLPTPIFFYGMNVGCDGAQVDVKDLLIELRAALGT